MEPLASICRPMVCSYESCNGTQSVLSWWVAHSSIEKWFDGHSASLSSSSSDPLWGNLKN